MSAATSSLTGTFPLLRASIRHDGRSFAPWILIVTALSASSVLVYPFVFPTGAEKAALAGTIGANPAIGLIFGPAYDLSTADGFNAWRALALGGFLVALGAIFTVTRATRAQEDSGQAELLASAVMGRSARLMAGVLLALLGSLVAGAVTGLVTVLCGGGWGPSLLLGATFTAASWMFAAVAALAAQLGSDARNASSMAVGTLGVLFTLRGLASSLDGPAWTLWVNPLGWLQETRPASGDHWAPLLLALGLTTVVVGCAFDLQARRDFGQGLVALRPGPARGAVRTPWALALRLNRASLASWAIAFVALGVVFGYFVTSITDLLAGDAAVQQILAAGAASPDELTGAFLRMILTLIGIIAAVVGVQVMLKVRAEELADRVEPVLATALSRTRYLTSHIVLAFASTGALVLVAGSIVAAFAAGADIGVAYADAFWQAAATVPAVWTVVALAVAVVGARPVVSIAAWAGVVVSFVLTLLGPTFGLDDWVLAMNPFWHVPDVGAADAGPGGLVLLSVVTLGLLVLGLGGFRRRDLAR